MKRDETTEETDSGSWISWLNRHRWLLGIALFITFIGFIVIIWYLHRQILVLELKNVDLTLRNIVLRQALTFTKQVSSQAT